MPLALALQARGRTAWIDKTELQLGDRLRQKIDEGLVQSRFGVVILSASFFAKQWPTLELDGLANRELEEKRKVILPVRHGLRTEDVTRNSALLGGILSVSTDAGISAIADMIVQVLKREEEAAAISHTTAIPSTAKDGSPKKSADETDFTTGRPGTEITDQSAPDSKQLIEVAETLKERERLKAAEAREEHERFWVHLLRPVLGVISLLIALSCLFVPDFLFHLGWVNSQP